MSANLVLRLSGFPQPFVAVRGLPDKDPGDVLTGRADSTGAGVGQQHQLTS